MKNIIISLFFLGSSYAAEKLNVQTFDWNGIEVVWLEEKRFPTYDVVVYYGEGALGDKRSSEGEVSMMFGMLGNGTPKYSQAEISEKLDFYGSNLGSSVTHEYSTLSYSGLSKDIIPVTELVCHVLNEANFPESELRSVKKRAVGSLKNLVANHGALANRIFRRISFQNSPFSTHTDGSIRSIQKISRASLLKSRNYFNKKVYKKIFLSGPKEILKIKNTIVENCKWKNQKSLFKRTKNPPKDFLGFKLNSKEKLPLYFASVEGANQAQIRVGNALPVTYFDGNNFDLSKLLSAILGGSFTSLLMQELRVKRGLTYGAYSIAAPQYLYGRSIVSTSTKNETVLEALYTIRDTLKILTEGKITNERVEGTKKYLMGKHIFKFESQNQFLSTLVQFDHLGRRYSEIYNFPENLKKFSRTEVISHAKKLFDWRKQIIFVLGNKSLKQKIIRSNLFELKEVKVRSYL